MDIKKAFNEFHLICLGGGGRIIKTFSSFFRTISGYSFQLEDENILLNKKGEDSKCMHSPRGGRSRMTHSSLICTYLDSLLLCVTVISSTHIVTSRKIKRKSRVCLHQVIGYRTTKRSYHIRHTIKQEPSILSNTFSLSIIK